MAQLWIVAGPNGAGKTTLAERWLAHRIPVVSPDAIAASHGFTPIQAGRKAVLEQERLLRSALSFALDTTLSGNRELTLMKRAASVGYKINVIFVCVESVALCHARIRERVDSGGHAVPAVDVADRIFVLDNTGEKRRLLLSVDQHRVKHLSRNLPQWARETIPEQITRLRSNSLGQ